MYLLGKYAFVRKIEMSVLCTVSYEISLRKQYIFYQKEYANAYKSGL